MNAPQRPLQCISEGPWSPQVSKLARKLPVGDVKVMAAQLGGAQRPAAVIDTSDLNEDDLT